MKTKNLLLIPLVICSACAIGPDYSPPEIKLAAQFSVASTNQNQTITAWWQSFNDQQLIDLINTSLNNNKSILQALEKVRELRALRRDAVNALFPTINTTIGYNKSYISASQSAEQGNRPRASENFDAGFEATWEIDLFGRLRRGLERQSALEAAATFDLIDGQRILITEVAKNYFLLRGNQNELQILKNNISNLAETSRLIELRFKAGESSALQAAQALAQYQNAAAAVPQLEAQIQNNIHDLSYLLGLEAAKLNDELSKHKELPIYSGPTNIGSPSDLLKNRPDIRAAERRLAAQTAAIGVATGDLFPKINFFGNLGLFSDSWDSLSDNQAHAYSITPRINWSILSFVAVLNRIAAADARAAQALAAYEDSVLNAIKDTENALSNYSAAAERYRLLTLAAASSTKAVELARKQYDLGATDFLSLLDSERSNLNAQEQLASSRTSLNVSIIAIYKALGGGWEDEFGSANQ